LSSVYLNYLQQRGTKEAMKEFLQVDRELNGPHSIQPPYLQIPLNSTRGKQENGHPLGEVDDAALKKGEVRYSTYFQERRDFAAGAQGLAPFL